ncbi:MAG: mandelate racemase [Pseudomonadales bacterium]|nr:mandelate racemase [Pseudomonadales bacterium]
MGLEGAIANAMVSFADHTVSLVALITDQQRGGRPVVGYGFNSIGRFAQGGILRERLFPRLLGADPQSLLAEDGGQFDPAKVAAASMRNEKPGGHGDRAGAAGAVELAVWDLNAKLNDEPAYVNIARHAGRSLERRGVSVYAAGGYYYPQDSLLRLREELKGYQALGFDAFKIKIGGAPLTQDMARIEAALQICGAGSRLAVDANGRFGLEEALACGRAIQSLNLRWYEEPGDPLDYELNCTLTQAYDGALATGENLFSLADSRNLIRYAGMRAGKDVFQMDPGISYGLTEYGQILATLEAAGFDRKQCYPHGGHLINLHIAVGLGLGGCEAYPGVFQPFGGYAPECRIENGQVWPGDAPGFGLEQKPQLRPHLAALV